MATIVINRVNWPVKLADAVRDSQDGDVIQVATEAMRELGERAKARMCPDKNIAIVLTENNAG